MTNTVIIFGGADFEEAEARRIARKAGLITATATTTDGKKVYAGNAYQATGYELDELPESTDEIRQVIIFECSPKVAGNLEVITHFDHHNPGDYGFELGAGRFFEASSLGQLINHLGLEPTQEQRLIAAGDHCPVAAYAGLCPGIDPEEFAQFRIQQKLVFYVKDERNAHKNTETTLAQVIASAREKLRDAPIFNELCDVRDAGHIDELPEAAMSLGVPYITQIEEEDRQGNKTGNLKILVGGETTPEMVTNFMEWANQLPNKVGDAYRNPTRGFAGIVIKPE